MKQLKSKSKSILSIIISFMVILSAISPSFVVTASGASVDAEASSAEPTAPNQINSFTAEIRSGAENIEGNYIWKADDSSKGHTFLYRVNYSLSGEGFLDPGTVTITIPKQILRDRSGTFADIYDIAVPTDDEAIATTKFSYHEDGDNLVITNHSEISAAEQGYIEIGYITSKTTFDYADMGKSDDFQAFLTVNANGSTLNAETNRIPVYIDTAAEISHTNKYIYHSQFFRSWDNSWGKKHDDADDYYYLYWTVCTYFKKNVTQPYDFELSDDFSVQDGSVVGYKMAGSSTFSSVNTALNQRTDTYRYDYVLTRHKKSTYDPQIRYVLENKITATVTPVDRIDDPTSAVSSDYYDYDKPEFEIPIGHFNSWKYGNSNWISNHNYYWDIANYGLEEFQSGEVDSLDDNLKYEVIAVGYPYPWTLKKGSSSDDHTAYGKRNVKYVVTDDTFYFNDNCTVNDGTFVPDENSKQLESSDYEIINVEYKWTMKDAEYDDFWKHFTETDVTYTDNDILHFKAKFGDSNEWVEVGTYNLKTGSADYNSTYVKSLTNDNIEFAENCTGYQIIAENAHYYTYIYAMPYLRVKNSQYILDQCEGKKKVYLTNVSNTTVYDADGNQIFTKDSLARDYIIGIQRQSDIQKRITNTVNNKVNKYLNIGWEVRMSETFTNNEGTDHILQNSGTYYDLLPKGSNFSKDTVSVRTEQGEIADNAYDVSTVPNYNNTGRTLLIVHMKEQAKYYTLTFSTTYPWESIFDYGTKILNSVAYETGNDKIANGFADNGGLIDEKDLMANLDPTTDEKKFIYAQKRYDINVPTAADAGLTKTVKSSNDLDYSSKTTVNCNEIYSYKLRYSTTTTTKAKDIILFDSLENFKEGDWKGTLEAIDVTQPVSMGVAPVIYYSKEEDLNIDDRHDLGDGSVWVEASQISDLSEVKAIAIDLRRTPDNENYILGLNQSLTVIVYMKAPASDETEAEDPTTYNNVYSSNTVISETGSTFASFIRHDYTSVNYRVTGDFGIYKADEEDETIPVKDVKFCLDGTSDYGTGVYKILATDINGHIKFKEIEKGEYKLYEYSGVDDYRVITDFFNVKIDGSGKVTIDGKAVEGEYTTITDPRRKHTDIEFFKKDLVTHQSLTGIKFKLYGKSDYGNDIIMYAESKDDEAGKGHVIFENVELGKYTLEEIETDSKHILSSTTFSVVVDENSNFSISDSVTEKNGTITVYNEPYHSFTISKIGYTLKQSVVGAKFTLKGTSNYGTEVDEEVITGADSKATFSGLEAGDYILQETYAPEGYVLDDTKRIVTIEKDGTVTIEGLEDAKGTAADPFVITNKENGTVTITKKWYDNSDNAHRPTPVVNISSEVPEQAAYFGASSDTVRYTFSYGGSIMYHRSILLSEIVGNSEKIKAFKPGTEAAAKEKISEGKTYFIDDGKTKFKIYAWIENDGTVYWWSNAQTVYMTNESHNMFTMLDYCETIDLSGINMSQVTTLSGMFYYCKKLTSIKGLSELDTSNITDMTAMFFYCNNLSEVDLSSFNTSNVTNMYGMFWDCKNLTTLDVSKFDTANVTNMAYMFSSCSSLIKLDVSKFDTANVTNMAYMFNGCSSLPALDVSEFDTANVTNMAYMFNGCSSLTELDVSKFDTANVTNMAYMFSSCSSLTKLDVSHFNTSNVTNMDSMFRSCNSLTELDVSHFNTSNVTNMSSMFSECTKLTTLDVSKFDTANVTDMSCMFCWCRNLTKLDLRNFNTSNVTNMSEMFSLCYGLTELDLSNFNTSNVTDMSKMFYFCDILTNLNVSKFDTSNVTNMSEMFSNCYKLPALDLSSFDTSNVTDMSSMFYECRELTTLNLSKSFNTSKVKTMRNMFCYCNKLTELDVSNFDTSEVITMAFMFNHCTKLTELDVSQFNTSKVKDMAGMFSNCSSLTKLDVSKFNTSNVTDMNCMFSGCSNLPELDVSNFNTLNVKDMHYMFSSCNELTKLDLSSFDTSKVTGMQNTFSGCQKLTELDLSSFDTSKFKTMQNMFSGCQKLTKVDLSSFDTSKVTDISYMFSNDKALTTIYVSNLWDTSKVSSSNGMFGTSSYSSNTFCIALVGGEGTTFDSSQTDKTYARIDNPPDEPGYFTYKAAPSSLPNPSGSALPTAASGSASALPVIKLNAQPTSKIDVKPLANTSASSEKVSASKTEKSSKNIAASGDSGSTTYNFQSPSSGTFENGILKNDNCTVEQIDENTWTFTFTGLDPKLEYYVWEEDLKDYISSNDITNPLVVTDGKGTITNSKGTPPTFGTLTVSKSVESEESAELTAEDKERTFLFTVTLTDKDGKALTGKVVYGDVVFTDGVGQFRLGDGDSVSMTDIPTGYNYTISETTEDGFDTKTEVITSWSETADDGTVTEQKETTQPATDGFTTSGTIAADKTITAKFTNTKNEVKSNNTSFTLEKVVTGNFQLDSKYKFIVSLEGLKNNTTYKLSNGDTFKSDYKGGAVVTVELGNGEKVKFNDIPVGSKYRITEMAGDYTSSYVITDSNYLGLIKNDRNYNTEENKALSTALETADKDEDVTVTFTNKRFAVQNLVLKKVVTNASGVNNELFNFSVEFKNLNSNAIINSTLGKITAATDGTVTVDFTMSNNQEVIFYDLPVGTKYTVTEGESNYYASYTIQDSNNMHQIVNAASSNDTMNKILSTQEETVDEGEEATVTFTNDKATRDVTVTKQIDMTNGDVTNIDYKAQEFNFTVVLTGLDGSTQYTVDLTETELIPASSIVFYSDAYGSAVQTITLRHGQSFTIRSLPVNSTYTITEQAAEHYVSSYAAVTNNGAVITKVKDENEIPSASLSTATETVDSNDYDVEFIFTNTYTATDYTLPNSGLDNKMPVIYAAMCGFLLFAALYLVTNRKRNEQL